MAGKTLRGAIVGATGLLGKELAEELNQAEGAAWDLTLLDATETDALGSPGGLGAQITAAGDEAMIVLPVTAEALAGMDVVFFAGDRATAKKMAPAAHAAGASIVDLTGALEGQANVVVRSPWTSGGRALDLATVGVVAGHPAAVMLAMAAERLHAAFAVRRMAATVLEPASQQGSAGVDEMHQQTVALLSFKPLGKDLYDAQVAFNLRAEVVGAAKVDLLGVGETITRQVAALAGAAAAGVTVQMVQAPVFHGATASVFVELATAADVAAVRLALAGGVFADSGNAAPSNESVAGQRGVEFFVRDAGGANDTGAAFWLWMAADNLRLAARHAAACAVELAALRPVAGVN